MTSHTCEFSMPLLGTQTHLEFLEEAYRLLKQQKPSTTYASLARKGGFAARSHVREILTGKKRITLRSFPSITKAMGLNRDQGQYLRLLLALEFSDFNPDRKSAEQIRSKMRQIHARSRKFAESLRPKKVRPEIFHLLNWPLIYASLGDPQTGSTLLEICKRCGLSTQLAERTLGEMIKFDVVHYDSHRERFFAANHHLIFDKMTQSGKIQEAFQAEVELMQRRNRTHLKSETHLFFNSVFSVRQEEMPKLKEALWKVLIQFVDRSEDAQGDGVASLICGLFPRT